MTSTGASVGGLVNPNGLVTQGWFQYGTNNDLSGAQSTAQQNLGSGSSNVAYNTPLSGLSPGTVYYFRAVAKNSAGTNVGSTANFTTLASTTPPSLTNPSSSPLYGATTFSWDPGSGSSLFSLWVGTGGPGTHDLYSSGQVASTVTSENVTIPPKGATLYVRLRYDMNGVWNHVDYSFTEATPAAVTSPAPNSTIAGPTATFTWTAGTGATAYGFRLGTTVGGNNLFASGVTTATSRTVSNLPTNGETIYARVYTYFGSINVYADYVFTAATAAALTAPTPSTTLTGAKVTFTWSAGTEATGYALRLGTTLGGNNLYGSGVTTATSKTVSNLPTNGETIYARVYTYFGSSQVYTDYVFTAYTAP